MQDWIVFTMAHRSQVWSGSPRMQTTTKGWSVGGKFKAKCMELKASSRLQLSLDTHASIMKTNVLILKHIVFHSLITLDGIIIPPPLEPRGGWEGLVGGGWGGGGFGKLL